MESWLLKHTARYATLRTFHTLTTVIPAWTSHVLTWSVKSVSGITIKNTVQASVFSNTEAVLLESIQKTVTVAPILVQHLSLSIPEEQEALQPPPKKETQSSSGHTVTSEKAPSILDIYHRMFLKVTWVALLPSTEEASTTLWNTAWFHASNTMPVGYTIN